MKTLNKFAFKLFKTKSKRQIIFTLLKTTSKDNCFYFIISLFITIIIPFYIKIQKKKKNNISIRMHHQ